MHEPFQPQCCLCAKFVRCFPDDSPLAEWGYCSDEIVAGSPRPEALSDLEKLAASGDLPSLYARASALGLYPETDDGCEGFVFGSPQTHSRPLV